MTLWRISNYADLAGIGGVHSSARWHTAGRPVVYLAESPSSALLEILVHLELEEGDRPQSYQLLKIEADDKIRFEEVLLEALPGGWKESEAITRAFGDAWLATGKTALLRVPSVITPETWIWLLNPRHSNAAGVKVVGIETHLYDSRLARSLKSAAANPRALNVVLSEMGERAVNAPSPKCVLRRFAVFEACRQTEGIEYAKSFLRVVPAMPEACVGLGINVPVVLF